MSTLSSQLIPLFERDLKKLSEEISLYKNEKDLWLLKGDIKNTAGNLVLHLIGNLHFYIGATLGKSGFVRNRDKEFSDKNIPRENILLSIDELQEMVKKILTSIPDEQMLEKFPIDFLGKRPSTVEMLFIVYGHLNYHLGQINYHRRITE